MMNLDVIYCDNHLLAVNKPSGLLTQPSGTSQVNLEDLSKIWLKEKFNKPGNVFLEAVHRIDKPVSGVVLFARTSKALSRLQKSVREKNSRKQYLATVEGIPKDQEGTLEHYLVHDNYYARVASRDEEEAKFSRLHYRVIGSKEGKSLLEIDLETGRYHQIRAQLSAMGLPIVGDTKYGSRSSTSKGIALHHCRLEIPHPIQKETQIIEAKMPTELFLDIS